MSDGRVVALAETIGRGAYGGVQRGVLQSAWGLRRHVAVKIYDVSPEENPNELMRRIAAVAQRAACVRHPSVVETLEIHRTEATKMGAPPRPFVVMEHVDGEALASILKNWRTAGIRVPVDFALVVTLRVAEALGAALFTDDADGVLTSLAHGDLSPRQVLVSPQGDVKVCDFGQGLLREVVSHVRTRDRLAYTAPEVGYGLEPDARADVFSLGVMLYEMLLGPRFPPGTQAAEAVQMVRKGAFHSSAMVPNLPRDLRALLDKAIAPNRLDRHAHARAFAFDVRREMLRMGLTDAQTCVRHAVVGWCEVRSSDPPMSVRRSDVVPRGTSRAANEHEEDPPDTKREGRTNGRGAA